MEITHLDAGAAAESKVPWRTIRPAYSFDNLILPRSKLALLRAIPAALRRREWTYSLWSASDGAALRTGRPPPGLRLLFAGDAGTGKMMAARILGGELRRSIVYVHVASLVPDAGESADRLVGRLFAEVESSDAILFLDAAHAWLDQHSRPKRPSELAAAIEASDLLERSEDYRGVIILAKGSRTVGEAPDDRFDFVVDFPFPDAPARRRIWSSLLPDDARVSNPDLDYLATSFELSGGEIHSCCLAAGSAAKLAGTPIERLHLIRAVNQQDRGRPRDESVDEALDRLKGGAATVVVDVDEPAAAVEGSTEAVADALELVVEHQTPAVQAESPAVQGESPAVRYLGQPAATSGVARRFALTVASPAAPERTGLRRQPNTGLRRPPNTGLRRQPKRSSSPRRGSRRYAMLALSGTVAAAVLGFVVAQGTSGGQSPPASPKAVAVGPSGVAPSASYAAGLNTVIGKLNSARVAAASQLRAAPNAQAQASAAEQLAAAHADAASALRRLSAGPANATNSALAAALTVTGDAYGALGRAAAHDDARGYSTANATLTRATNSLNSELGQLSTLGYRVG